MDAKPSERRKIETVVEQGKKTMVKEMTQSLAEFEAMPVEVLVRIFKCLPNHDIRCRISLACQKFYKICLDKSLVPVKDLCIYGHIVGPKSKKKTDHYSLSLEEIDSVLDIISQSKNLTFLKIKALGRNHVPNLRHHPVDELVSMALQSCPKLTHLEIIEPDYMASE